MKTEQLAKILGYAGLLPFIVFSLAAWSNLPHIGNAHFILTAYAAVILSFMGAIHWGLAMSQQSGIAARQLGLSVVPALLGWLALLLPLLYRYPLLMAAFIGLCVADKVVNDRRLLPGWYWPMRLILTSVVVLCLALALLAAYGR